MKKIDVSKKIINSMGYVFITIIFLLQFYLLIGTDRFYIYVLTNLKSHGMNIGLGDFAGIGLLLVTLSFLLFFISFQKWYWSSKEDNKPIEAYMLSLVPSLLLPFLSCGCMLIILGDGIAIFLRIVFIILHLGITLLFCSPFYFPDCFKKEVCSSCGEEIGTDNYCSNCGKKIVKDTPFDEG